MSRDNQAPVFGRDRGADTDPAPTSNLTQAPRRRPNHSLLNWSNCRQYALDVAKETRPASNFDRVSQEQVHPHLEAIVRKAIERLVHTQPSGVRTIKIESHKRRPV